MSLGYEEQCRSMTPMPAMSLNVTSVAVPTDRVMLLLVAVNGPTVSAGDGTSIATPDDGMGLGIGTSKATAPVGIDEGVAPAASIAVEMVPSIDVRPMALICCTTDAGSWACICAPVRLNCCPGVGLAGDSAPVTATSLRTRFPTGVPGQKISKGEVSAKAELVNACVTTPATNEDPISSASAPMRLR